MKKIKHLPFFVAMISMLGGASSSIQAAAQTAEPIEVNGVPVVTLTPPSPLNRNQPHFVRAIVLPGVGMNLLELKAYVPGSGEVNVIGSINLADAKKLLENDNDAFGDKSFSTGGAILLPFANRIRGTLSADGKSIETTIGDKQVSLPANSHGKNPGAPLHALHGLIFASKFQDVKQADDGPAASVSALLHAGNFNGHWLSKTDVSVQMALSGEVMDIAVTAKNVAHDLLPMAIGFHPYFNFPSGDRQQGRIHIPAVEQALVTNYDDVFPTGQIVPVKNTPYDFTNPKGTALGSLYLDDSFTDVQRSSDGAAHVEIIDPKAHYGVHILAISPQIKAIQVYAPLEKNFVAIEPQFNLVDPFNKKLWGNRDTGVVWLKPGQSVTWHIKSELFVPAA
jgi:galactose mutarotase-like enzyme